MKILIVSDSHYFNEYLENITNRLKNKVDLMIHCGDSSLEIDNPLLKDYLCVKGNHDDADFPIYLIKDEILITHGQYYNVYLEYDTLVSLCKQNNCKYCFHGHTHIPTHQFYKGIHFINPGSIMMNRGSYGFGTFAVAEINKDNFDIHFYHHQNFKRCDYVLDEGLELLKEFKNILKSK